MIGQFSQILVGDELFDVKIDLVDELEYKPEEIVLNLSVNLGPGFKPQHFL
jgi:hypothetical protein